MKSLKMSILLVAGFCLLNACTEPDFVTEGEEITKNESAKTVKVTVPFEAKFIGDYVFNGPDPDACGPPFFGRTEVDYKGEGTHLGAFSGNFNFCFAKGGYYGPTTTCMIAANGDRLILYLKGKVNSGRLSDHPEYVVQYWRDPFEILGGTGRFEGATGSGFTDDYNSSRDKNSHHHWKGTITLIKGNTKTKSKIQ